MVRRAALLHLAAVAVLLNAAESGRAQASWAVECGCWLALCLETAGQLDPCPEVLLWTVKRCDASQARALGGGGQWRQAAAAGQPTAPRTLPRHRNPLRLHRLAAAAESLEQPPCPISFARRPQSCSWSYLRTIVQRTRWQGQSPTSIAPAPSATCTCDGARRTTSTRVRGWAWMGRQGSESLSKRDAGQQRAPRPGGAAAAAAARTP